ncbi:MAG: 2-amino-4-hydroxy-6-hydroxymethyldihydropteridine diphosphokinase [Clostridium sp.]|nr:2-amino-4-hydroxy-6-hydroxymethyldihydropteridine diphosphokinase [Clostridium sp.]MCM1400142.1 2-amino-4-hydroxy-6-hydroxymethyldihydropteridine diphosphokinase [Clostridium sp.]MCM1460829.1 2-amino-4-hydroxy-6-hydroxymethyldihydropteridine diphosphokinase [Bacteroides sp.]
MDKIVIKDLELFAYHGVLPQEKREGQTFIVTVELFLDLHGAGTEDDLSETVNYAMVCNTISRVMTEEKYDLIEAAAETVADTILLEYEKVSMVHVILSKPEAPIEMTFDTVCVDITRGRHTVYLGLGSNLGDRESYLDYAVDQLNKDEYIKVNKVSTYINTKPYGDVEQDDFLNGCLEIETLYSPQELLAIIGDIEQGAGRKRLIHWGPRTLDIDILLYDREIIMEENLKIPHAEMAKRQFVLEPLCEIAPFAYHPGYNRTIIELLDILHQNEETTGK